MSKNKVIGIMHMSGISQKNAQPYDMCQIHIISPMESKKTATYDRVSIGYESSTLELAPESFPDFKELKYPLDMELIFETEIINGNVRSKVVGYKL